MKRVFAIIASVLFVLSAASCSKVNNDLAPYYRIATSSIWKSGSSGTSDFSRIYAVTDQYVNRDFSSEEQAMAAYNDILSKTKDVPYTAPEGSYFKMLIEKYIGKQSITAEGTVYECLMVPSEEESLVHTINFDALLIAFRLFVQFFVRIFAKILLLWLRRTSLISGQISGSMWIRF